MAGLGSLCMGFGCDTVFHLFEKILDMICDVSGDAPSLDVSGHPNNCSKLWKSRHDFEIFGQEIKVFVKCKASEILRSEALVDSG